MGRLVLSWVCVCALVALPVGGCSDEMTPTGGAGGSGDTGGDGGTGGAAGEGGGGGANCLDSVGGPQCETASDCPRIPDRCRVVTCVDGVCESEPGHDGNQFCDLDPCTEGGTCSNGECIGGTPLEDGTACGGDFNQCTDDICMAGVCEHISVGDGVPCDEDNECTVGATCAQGDCVAVPAEDETPCGDGAGACQAGRCSGSFACTEAGVLDAIALGGGPHTFECDGRTTVDAVIVIDNDVELDGEGELVLNAGRLGRGLVVRRGTTATLRRFGLLGEGAREEVPIGAIVNEGRLAVVDSTVSVGGWGGFHNGGELTVVRSAFVDGGASWGLFMLGRGSSAQIINSTLTGSTDGDLMFADYVPVTIVNSTIGKIAFAAANASQVQGSVVVEGCDSRLPSGGHNIESPGNTCGFDQPTDQVCVGADDLKLGPLQDNGGPTMTHALGAGSVAIDVIPAHMCEVDEDQRGVVRPQGDACDVGAVEMEVTP